MWQYALNDAPVEIYDPTSGAPMPDDLSRYLEDENVLLLAHNAAFDSTVIDYHRKRLGQKPITPTRWRCVMAQALAHSLPGALEKLGDAFKLSEDEAKLKDGKALVRLFCMPRPKKQKLRRATSKTHPEEWKRFIEYGRRDVDTMRRLCKMIPRWNYDPFAYVDPAKPEWEEPVAVRELRLWHRDQVINKRGVFIDRDLVDAALATAERVKEQLAEETYELTDESLEATTQRNALLALLNGTWGLNLPDLRGSTIEPLVKPGHNLPEVVAQLLENRLAASSTSISKYKRFQQLTGADGWLRFTLQFCGASRTARWAGRGVQLQNLPRPTFKKKAIVSAIEAIKLDVADLIYPLSGKGSCIEALASSIRGAIIAPPGKKLVVADLSNIEGRMLAWLAGEEWKLKAFYDFDTIIGFTINAKGEPEAVRKGHDLYALAYAKAFGVSPEAVMDNKENGDGSMRQIGKVMELALGYAGGVGAFITFALAYGIDLEALAEQAAPGIPTDTWEAAKKFLAWKHETPQKRFTERLRKGMDKAAATALFESEKTVARLGLSEKAFLVCDSFKRLWRDAHPNIVQFWADIEGAFRTAINAPNGTVIPVGKCKVTRSGTWVRIILPSGRSLCYPGAKINEDGNLTYMGINQFSRQWNRIKTYSGKLVENATQAASRDVIATNIPFIEEEGYEIAVTVHDEDITYAPDVPEYSVEGLAGMMARNPEWAFGLPLAAAGFEDYRYRKD